MQSPEENMSLWPIEFQLYASDTKSDYRVSHSYGFIVSKTQGRLNWRTKSNTFLIKWKTIWKVLNQWKIQCREKVEFYSCRSHYAITCLVIGLQLIFKQVHCIIFGLFTSSCHSADHCRNLLLWYYWGPAHEGQFFATGLSDKYLSASLVIFAVVSFFASLTCM